MSLRYITGVIVATLEIFNPISTYTLPTMVNLKRKQQNRDAQRRYREKKKREMNQSRPELELTPEANDVSSSCPASLAQEPACSTTATQSTLDSTQGKLIRSRSLSHRLKYLGLLKDAFCRGQKTSSISTVSRDPDPWQQATNVDMATPWPLQSKTGTNPRSEIGSNSTTTLQTLQPQSSMLMRLVNSTFQKREEFMRKKNSLRVKQLRTQTKLCRHELEMWCLRRKLAELG